MAELGRIGKSGLWQLTSEHKEKVKSVAFRIFENIKYITKYDTARFIFPDIQHVMKLGVYNIRSS